MISFDLSGASSPSPGMEERFSPPTLKKAHEAVRRGLVTSRKDLSGGHLVTVRSLSGYTEYAVALVFDEQTGELLGARCTCPSGRNNVRAICYHAAAVELIS